MKIIKNYLVFCSCIFISTKIYTNDLKSELQEKINNEIPQWISEQITNQLKDFTSSGITEQMIEKTIENNPYLTRYKIINGNLILKSKLSPELLGNHYALTSALEHLCSLVPMPNVDFCLCLHDATGDYSNYLAPVFSFCSKLTDKNIILIPDTGCLYNAKNNVLVEQVKAGTLQYPWHVKQQMAFWRGSTTGGIYTIDNYKQMPRAKLVRTSRKFPQALDAKFNNIVQMGDNKVEAKLIELNYVSSGLPVVEHLKYKYQILIDGNSASWERAYWQLFSNSVILKQESEWTQWYYCKLKPYNHYIPFRHDVEDLPEKINWAIDHDERVQEIIKNANQVAQECLNYSDMLLYLYVAIVNYSKLQKFSI